MDLENFRMLIYELLNKDPDIVPEEASLIVLDSKSAMCLVCLVSLPFLAIHIANLLSKTIKGASSGTMSGSLFKNHESTS